RWTKSNVASASPLKPQIIPKNNCARKWSPSTRFVPAKTWWGWKKLLRQRNRKNIAQANRNVAQRNRTNQKATQRRNRRRNSCDFSVAVWPCEQYRELTHDLFPGGANDEVTSWRDKHLFYMYVLTRAELQQIQ